MIRFEEARKLIIDRAEALPPDTLQLMEAPGRILAEDILSDTDMPPFDKSAMDGYACRREDLPGPLEVLETIAAGEMPGAEIRPGTCSKIMTGAPVPSGADCVIKVEDTEAGDDNRVRFLGEQTLPNICYLGEDVRKGDVLLSRGTRIGPREIAVMASAGYSRVKVFTAATVGIASTGNELYPPGKALPEGSIRDSNSYQLEAQVLETGMKTLNLGIVKDTSEDIGRAISKLEEGSHVILLTGGVSYGDFDLVPGELSKAGFKEIFHKVAVKPGMPLWFGHKGNKFCFGMPGNPVSTFVQFEYLIKPFLLALSGHRYEPLVLEMPLADDIKSRKSDRDSIIPVKRVGDSVAKLEYHGSAHISAIPKADGFIMIPAGKTLLKKGERIDVRFL